jgi:sulfur-carrier protein adenylyltransferase/sulfurtransferase
MKSVPLTPEEKNRYARHLTLAEVGLAGQQQLKAARVLVIGAGGLGCPVLQYLAAAGVGTLGIVDFDLVEESNLQRQILFTGADLGKPKAEAAREKLRQLNPLVQVVPYVTRLTAANALALLQGYDLVIDGSDNFATRYLVNDACVLLDKPLVFGSIFRFEGQVSVFNYQGGPTYRCLYPEPGELAACAEAGVLGVLPGLVGCLMANETIKLITGAGQVLSGRLLVLDALTLHFSTFTFSPDPENKHIRSLPAATPPCGEAIADISAADLMARLAGGQQLTLLDVREEAEYAAGNIGAIPLPLHSLEQSLGTIAGDLPVVVHCQTGLRSRKAADILVAHGFQQVYNLKGGLAGLDAEEREMLRRLLQ